MPSDESFPDLLRKARSNDPDALQALFERFYPRVQRMVHSSLSKDLRTKRPWLIARFSTGDVVQEVFGSVLKDLKGFGGSTEGAFAGYLSVLIRNRILDAVRFHEAARRDIRRSDGDSNIECGPGRTENPADALVLDESMRRMRLAMATFPDREQILLRARFEGTETLANLTEQLGYPSLATTRRAFLAAQAKLAIMLQQD